MSPVSHITSSALVPSAGRFSKGVARMNSFLEVLEVQWGTAGAATERAQGERRAAGRIGLASGLQVQETTLISVNLRKKKTLFFVAEIAV